MIDILEIAFSAVGGIIAEKRAVVDGNMTAESVSSTSLHIHTSYDTIPCMQMTFIQLTAFANRWVKLKLCDEDLQALEQQLQKNPDAGEVMRGTGGMRKIRFAPPSMHTGKSGALRIGYAYFRMVSTLYLFTVFAKKDQANLTAAECAVVKQTTEALTEFHKK